MRGNQNPVKEDLKGRFANEKQASLEEIIALCKRRGFVFQSSDIYGGLASTYDYGPYGVELKKNIKDNWWKEMVRKHQNIVGLDAAIMMHPQTWQASGHLEGFSDPLRQCLGECKGQFRADHLDDPNSNECPKCGGILSQEEEFNMMFKTQIGAKTSSSDSIYLRPETAQGIFVNFKNVLNSSRQQIPFGIAQIGKAFRNEITTESFIFRTREFEQMEMEYFCHPSHAEEVYRNWIEERKEWYIKLGLDKDKLRLQEHSLEDLAHYSKGTTDIEYKFSFGWSELEGIANRGQFDLESHMKESKENLSVKDENNEDYIPSVIEPSAGVDRLALAFLSNAYKEESVQDKPRTVLSLSPKLAPVKAAVFPHLKKEGMPEIANNLFQELNNEFTTEYDEKGAIGKRYRRQDEIGTPYCVTIDHQTLEDQTVTIRNRDSLRQSRVNLSQVKEAINTYLNA